MKFFFVIGEPMEKLDALPIVLDKFGDGCYGGVVRPSCLEMY